MKLSGWINGAWILVLILGLAGVSWGADEGPISSGETKSGTITGPSFSDTWTFQGTAGDWIIITAVTTSFTLLDTTIDLYPPDGGPREATTDQGGFGGGDRLDHQLAQSGLYTIVIHDHTLSRTGDYNITLLKIPGAVSFPGDLDGGAVAPSECLSGTIDMASDLDAFQFY